MNVLPTCHTHPNNVLLCMHPLGLWHFGTGDFEILAALVTDERRVVTFLNELAVEALDNIKA